MADEESIVVDTFGGENNLLQVVLSFFKGRRFLDIRRYFKGSDGRMVPMKKGIALKLNDFHFLMRTLHENETQIADWLDRGEGEVWEELKRARIASEKARYEAKTFIRSARSERTAAFFSIAEEGGKLKLIYNSSHPLYGALQKALESAPGDSRMIELFDYLLVSYARCRAQFNPEHKVAPEELFEMLENEWGRGLRRYVEETGK